jgi:hypothetical protein
MVRSRIEVLRCRNGKPSLICLLVRLGIKRTFRSHRHVGLAEAAETREMIMLASHLLRIAETRSPDAPFIQELEAPEVGFAPAGL